MLEDTGHRCGSYPGAHDLEFDGLSVGHCAFHHEKEQNQLKSIYELPHGKTINLYMRKQKAQISFVVTAKLISVFVFDTQIVKFPYRFSLYMT